MLEVLEYLDGRGQSPFRLWFDQLDALAAARIVRIILRMSQGNLADIKSVGSGVIESRIHFGPGYRLYLHKDGDRLVVLLGGGTNRRQSADIDEAKTRLADYKKRKEALPWSS